MKLRRLLNIDKLSEKYLSLMRVYAGHLIYTSLHGVFVNTLFLKVTGDADFVKKYNLICYIFIPIMMTICTVVLRRAKMKVCFLISVASYIAMYLTFFATMDHLRTFMPLIALLSTAGSSFFMLANFCAISSFSTDQNRDATLSFSSMLGGIIHLTIPYLSGLVISQFINLEGYYIIFVLSFLVAGLTLYFAAKLPNIEVGGGESKLREMFRATFRTKEWRLVAANETFKGFREGVFLFFLNLLLYQLVQSEMLVGLNTVLTAVASIAANWIAGRFMRRRNRVNFIVISVCVLVGASFLLAVNASVTTILLFSFINAFFSAFLQTAYSSTFYMVLEKSEGASQMRPEFITMSQYCLNLGKVIGVLVILFMPQTTESILISFLILTLSQFVNVFLVRKINRLPNLQEAEVSPRRSPGD